MSDTTIRPALTPRGWALALGKQRLTHRDNDPYLIAWFDKQGRVCLPDAYMEYDITAEQRLEVAAVCLHGHPQGFTRSDWWQVDQAAMDAEELNRPEVQVAALRSLAARIEALLPPESA